MKSSKRSGLFFFFFLLGSTDNSLSDTISNINDLHDTLLQDIIASYSGVNQSHIPINPETMESTRHYKELALKDDLLDITPEMVDVYYENAGKAVQCPLHFTYVANKSHQRMFLNYPAGFKKPWEENQELIICNDSVTSFLIFHTNKVLFVSESDFSWRSSQHDMGLDILFFTYPLIRIDAIDRVSVKSQNSPKLYIQYSSPSKHDYIQKIYAELDPQHSYIASKLMIALRFFQERISIVYVENKEIESSHGIHFPNMIDVYIWRHYCPV
ncbi:MAG: hypothetical protein C4527_05600 [Candidatus Omnitrophota bacterium]|jgi:hypothetical protein|nr:MAG: hypothetical protein C4527_05600 [Candidatus Omnitrophota bacterium]